MDLKRTNKHERRSTFEMQIKTSIYHFLILAVIILVTSSTVFSEDDFRQQMLDRMQGQNQGSVRSLPSDTEEEKRRAAEFMQSDAAEQIKASYYNSSELESSAGASSVKRKDISDLDSPELLKVDDTSDLKNGEPNILTYIILIVLVVCIIYWLVKSKNNASTNDNTKKKDDLIKDTNPKVEWYVYCNSEIHGPFSLVEIKNKLVLGELPSATQICRNGDDKWSNPEDVINQELNLSDKQTAVEQEGSYHLLDTVVMLSIIIGIPFLNGFRFTFIGHNDKFMNFFNMIVFLSNHIPVLMEVVAALYFSSKIDYNKLINNIARKTSDKPKGNFKGVETAYKPERHEYKIQDSTFPNWPWVCGVISLVLLSIILHYQNEGLNGINAINRKQSEMSSYAYGETRANQIINSDNPIGEIAKEMAITKTLPYLKEGVIEETNYLIKISDFLKIVTALFFSITIFNAWRTWNKHGGLFQLKSALEFSGQQTIKIKEKIQNAEILIDREMLKAGEFNYPARIWAISFCLALLGKTLGWNGILSWMAAVLPFGYFAWSSNKRFITIRNILILTGTRGQFDITIIKESLLKNLSYPPLLVAVVGEIIVFIAQISDISAGQSILTVITSPEYSTDKSFWVAPFFGAAFFRIFVEALKIAEFTTKSNESNE